MKQDQPKFIQAIKQHAAFKGKGIIMLGEIRKLLSFYEIKEISEQTCEEIMEVYDTNQEFFLLSGGKVATPEDCKRDASATPPDFHRSNKLFLGIWKSGNCVGVMDILVGYPGADCVWIGLLLIHGQLHRNRMGSEFAEAIIKATGNVGCNRVQLGVLENNIKGRAFWTKLGFEKIREANAATENNPQRKIIVVEKLVERDS